MQVVSHALSAFQGSTLALQALDDHLVCFLPLLWAFLVYDAESTLSQSICMLNVLQVEPSVLLKLCQSVGKPDALQTQPSSTVASLSEAFILGRQHQSRGIQSQ